MSSVAIGYQGSGISHPSLWLGALEADHPALELHLKNTKCTSAVVKKSLEDTAQPTTVEADNKGSNTIQEVSTTSSSYSSTAAETQTTVTKESETEEEEKSQGIEVEAPKPWFALFPTDVAADLVEKTTERVYGILESSSYLENVPLEKKVPTFEMDKDIERGDQLGSGGFALIYNAKIKDPKRLASKGNCEYVIKHLAPELVNEERKLHIGCRDFLIESHLMATLHHPNILKLVGSSKGGLASYGLTLRTDAFFMVLPKLTCTLTERLKTWKEENEARLIPPKLLAYPAESKSFKWRHRILQENDEKFRAKDFFYYRVKVVIDLLSALEYLHEKRLFHRDIKPDNIGIDTEGCLKLFDFGLAKELPPDDQAMNKHATEIKSDLIFDFPGNTGTARYMAPEVILRKPYNCKVDVFAATIVCWEVLSLERAYVPIGVPSGKFFKDCVAIYNDRPPLHKKWPKSLRKVMKQGWIKPIEARFTSGKMKRALQKIVDEHCPKLSSTRDKPRRSTSTKMKLVLKKIVK